MLPSLGRRYLLTSLEGTPELLDSFVGELANSDSRWDFQAEPDRFTLREIVAHLTSIEPGWLKRTQRILDEEEPFFPRVALQNDAIARNTPQTNLAVFSESRKQFVEQLKGLTDYQWQRGAQSELLGPFNLEEQAIFIWTHDGYHLRQIAQWLKMAR